MHKCSCKNRHCTYFKLEKYKVRQCLSQTSYNVVNKRKIYEGRKPCKFNT